MSKSYKAGLKPDEVLEPDGLTLREVLMVIDAYDERQMDHFNLNTKVIAWHAIAPHVKEGMMPSLENFLAIEGENIDDDWEERYKRQVQKLTEAGIIKPLAKA